MGEGRVTSSCPILLGIKMVKLETDLETRNETMYFKTMEDCKEYLYVFKDHWCNLPFKDPVEIQDSTIIDSKYRNYLDIPPKQRAESDLQWGFNLVNFLGIGVTKEQKEFLELFA